jgi:PIN domain nuclease of toxin-antitoxin system
VRLLLDSHVVVWLLADDPALGPIARREIAGADPACVSAVTPWELGIKRALGRLEYPDGLVSTLVSGGFLMVEVVAADAELAPTLPPHHRDPFDRMLVAQAIRHELTIVTADRELAVYGLPLLPASL